MEPRPGAATVVGTDYVAKSAPDGHTLLINSTQFVQSPATFAKLPYDPSPGHRADHAHHHFAAGDRGAPVAAREEHPGAHRARESPARRAQHGNRGHRAVFALFLHAREGQDGDRAVQGRRSADDRRERRTRAARDRRGQLGAGRGARRARADAGGHFALGRVSRRAAHLEGRARVTTPTPGSRSSRRAARRRRSSRGYATTWSRCCRFRT